MYIVKKEKQRNRKKKRKLKSFMPEGLNTRATALAPECEKGLATYLNVSNDTFEPTKMVDDGIAAIILNAVKRVDVELYNELEKGIEDVRITRFFNRHDMQYDVLKEFLKPSVPNASHLRAYTMAREILNKYVLPKMKGFIDILPIHRGMHMRRVFSNMKASAGACRYGRSKEDEQELIISIALDLLANPTDPGLPALCFHRSQISGYVKNGRISPETIKYKDRLVWCVDAATVMVEGIFARPLMDYIIPKIPNYAGGKSDREINQWMQRWRKGKYYLCIDYSGYDSTVPYWIIKDIFELLKQYFRPDVHNILDDIRRRFINMSILMPDGKIYTKHKGIPSGSYFTQIIGSLVNAQIILTYICKWKNYDENAVIAELRDHEDYNILTFMAMGDDNVIFTINKIDIKDLSSYCQKVFGVKIEVASGKIDQGQVAGETPKFLKREWRIDGAYRDPLELLLYAIHPERWRNYDNYSPWHIIYGYYLTYRATMSKYFTEREILRGMADSEFGIGALIHVKLRDLPGSLRMHVMDRSQAWKEHIDYIKSQYAGNVA